MIWESSTVGIIVPVLRVVYVFLAVIVVILGRGF